MELYFSISKTPQLIYWLDEKYRNKGIMSKELPLFLQDCKNKNYNQMYALCKKNNIASKRLLEKNDFIALKEFRDTITFVVDLRVNKNVTNKIVKNLMPVIKA